MTSVLKSFISTSGRAAICILLFGPLTAFSRQGTGGRISGVVRSQSGSAISGAQITLTNEGNSSTRSVVTSKSGNYVFTGVDAGNYTLRAALQGYNPANRAHIQVNPGPPVAVDFFLASLQSADKQPHPPPTSASSLSSRPGYYDDTQLKSSSVNGTVDPGGYSSPGQARTSSRLLQGVAALKNPASDDSPGSAATNTEPSEGHIFDSGSELLLHQNFDAAIQVFANGVERYPQSAMLQIGLGVALYSRGRYEEAITALCAASDLAPADPRPYLFLGRMYTVSAGKTDEVSARLEHFTKVQPQNALAHYYYAMSLWKGERGQSGQVNFGQIEFLLKHSILLDPKYADAHLQLGILFAEQNKYPEAIHEYQQAIALEAGLVDAHYRLAQAYARTGEADRARAEMEIHERLRKQELAETEKQRAEIKQFVYSIRDNTKQ